MSETALAIPSTEDILARVQDLNLSEEDLAGYDGVKPPMPFLSIRQKDVKSEDGRKVLLPAGNFKWNDGRPDIDGEKGVRAVVIRTMPFRVMFPPDDLNATIPDCKSLDGQVPSEMFSNPPAVSCATCPNSKFGADGEKPACSQGMNLLCLDVDTFEPFIFSTKVTGLKPTNKYLGVLLRKRIPPMAVLTMIATERQTNGAQEYYIPAYQTVGVVEPDLFAKLRAEKAVLEAEFKRGAEQAVNSTDEQHADVIDGEAVPPADPVASGVGASFPGAAESQSMFPDAEGV